MPIIKTTFSEVDIGSYFTMRRGLLWRKVSPTEAIDVWSHRIIQVKSDVLCRISE